MVIVLVRGSIVVGEDGRGVVVDHSESSAEVVFVITKLVTMSE